MWALSKKPGFLWVAISAILLFGYAALVVAAGPFAPGATLDPIGDYGTGVCSSPTDVTCYVTTGWSLNTVSGYVYSATGDLVGIGDSTPTYKLDVNGDIAIGATAGTSAYKLYSTALNGGAGGYADIAKLVGNNIFLAAPDSITGIAGANISSGEHNLGIGFASNVSLTTGSFNTSLGSLSGQSLTDGEFNVFVGPGVGVTMSSGDANVFVGYASGISNTGNENILIGKQAGFSMTSGDNNIIIGTGINASSLSGSNQLNIGDTIYGDLSNDYISIGDTTPDFALDVEEDRASSYAASFFNDGNDANRSVVYIQGGLDDHTAAGPSTLIQFSDGNATSVGSITFGSSATAYNTTSDRRLKENITDTSLSLDLLKDIQIRDFTWIGDSEEKLSHGVIAQELYEVYPLAVTKPIDETTASWMVDYSKLVPLAVKAIQDLDITISSIQARMETLSTNQTFLEGLRNWFADATNGITDLWADRFRAREEICIEEVCINKEQLQEILEDYGGSMDNSNNGENEEEILDENIEDDSVEVSDTETEESENGSISESETIDGESATENLGEDILSEASGEEGGSDTESGDGEGENTVIQEDVGPEESSSEDMPDEEIGAEPDSIPV